MKLECSVVQDLYVLYQEDELSSGVKEAVANHLEGCEKCSRIYEAEEGFANPLTDADELKPSQKLDEKMLLRLKVKRLKTAVTFVAVILIIMIAQGYYHSRIHLISDLSFTEIVLVQLNFELESIKSGHLQPLSISQLVQTLNERNQVVYRNLNSLEKRSLGNNSGSLTLGHGLTNLLSMLNQRYKSGSWGAQDEEVLKRIMALNEKAISITTQGRLGLNKIYDHRFMALRYQVDASDLAEVYREINRLSLTYFRYNKLPESLALVPEEDLRQKLAFILGSDEVKLLTDPKTASILGIVNFDAKIETGWYHGQLDPYTGSIISVDLGPAATEGELLPRDVVEDNLLKFLEAEHGGLFEYDIKYQGTNYRFKSNRDLQLHTFLVYPVLEGFRLDFPLMFRFDARTGYLYSVYLEKGPVPKIKKEGLELSIHIDKDEALLVSDLPVGVPLSDLVYQETMLVKSLFTGGVLPVHVYSYDSSLYYISTLTGQMEFPVQ